MNAKLCSSAPNSIVDPSDYNKFFTVKEDADIRNKFLSPRELHAPGNLSEHCKDNLFFGFFHDGTRNNLNNSLEKNNFTQSNVARLYSAFPGQSVPGVVTAAKSEWQYEKKSFSNYFRVYTPGVGSAFPKVGDSGKGLEKTLGGAGAYLGERRVIWTLAQAVNNLHRYFLNTTLIESDEILNICSTTNLTAYHLQHFAESGVGDNVEGSTQISPRDAFEPWLKKLHNAIRPHMPDARTGKPQAIDPGIVKEIYVSVFGFSRGAASARVFSNWLVALCKLDAQMLGKPGMTLGGFTVNFDFVGLFDTVASVGLANTLGFFNGHGDWADSNVSLRIPAEVVKCLHLVAAHEVRRSFPLDSLSKNNNLAANLEEIVYPGVHSDLGGGYGPREQGKGLDATGKDMLSRLPLAHMYREARLAGVPLKLELADQWIKDDFMIAPATIEAFNKYVNLSKKKEGSLTEIMREQRKFYILWRLARRTEGLRNIDSFKQADPKDQNDLDSANIEFEEELNRFVHWKKSQDMHGQKFETQPPGFHNSSKDSEWEEVAIFFDKEKLPEEMGTFFDKYVHDSRAWFKLTGTESDDIEAELQAWVKVKNEFEASPPPIDGSLQNPLSQDQLKWATEYEKTKKVPRMLNGGREVMNGAGYLRYRRIYAGGDSILISRNPRSHKDTQTAGNAASAEDVVVSI